MVPGLLTALPGLRFWVVEPTQLVARRFGRERQIALDSIVELRRPRLSVSGAVVAVGADSTMRVPGQVDRFDELLDRLSLATDATPPRPANWDRHSAPQQAHPAPPTANDTSWQLSAVRTKVVLGFLVALLAFFWTWPWFLVGGDSPTRDSILFMGIGTLLWAAVALLVAQESFQRGQPVELSLTASGLTYRTFRRAPIQVAHHELLLATVEPDIIYVRGIPGQRYPLVLTLEGGARVRIDDMRARHLGSSTHALASAIRRHTFDPTKRSVAQRQEGEDLAADDDPLTLLRSFALDPQPDRSSLTRRAGDGFRNTGNHELAIAAYQFHLDTNPDDSASHQGLIAAYRSAGRDDLASEAAEAAERLLLG